MGFHLEASHHEVAIGQHEIDFRHEAPVACADNLITFRWVVRVVAAEHGMHATFMPKPIFGENGSGMHVNQSLSKDGENAFYDPKGELELSGTAYSYIAGPDGAPAGDHRGREPDRELVQAPGARLRGAGLHRLVARQPVGRDPRSRPSAAARPAPSCARPTRRRTRTWPSR